MKVNVTILPDENNIVLKSTLLPKYESTTAAGNAFFALINLLTHLYTSYLNQQQQQDVM